MKKYKAVLFDFDGVIGKTMEDNYEAWAHAFKQYNIKIRQDEYYLIEGKTTISVAEFFLEKYKSDIFLAKEIAVAKESYYLRQNSFELYPKAIALINKIKNRGLLIGLVTGGRSQRLSNIGINDLLKQFDVIVTGDMVVEGKPSPMPYLKATEQLRVNPSECLVIENAPLGIMSAKNAGMDCLAICSTLGRTYLNQADFIVGCIADLFKHPSLGLNCAQENK